MKINERQILEKISNSEETTLQIGGEFADAISLEKEAFIALDGDLGAGKTAFVRGMAGVLCPGARVCSPTYTVMRSYSGVGGAFYHFDMYRIESEDDLYSIGFDDYLAREGFCLTEWSENILDFIPGDCVRVSIEKDDPHAPDHRRITISFCKEETAK